MQSDNSTLEKELKLRVETRLYPAIKASMESIRINAPAILEKRRYTIINKFIDSLPEKFRGMNNLVPIVVDHLNKIENSLKKSSRVDPFER